MTVVPVHSDPPRAQQRPASRLVFRLGWIGVLLTAVAIGAAAQITAPTGEQAPSQTATSMQDGGTGITGPARLRQPSQADTDLNGKKPANAKYQRSNGADLPGMGAPADPSRPVEAAGDFELYVRGQTGGADIQRYGSDLLVDLLARPDNTDDNPLVPPDYVLRAGDELVLMLWGSVDADLRLTVDRAGRISIPRVGPVMVSGVRYADLPDVIGKRVGQVFKNFQLSVSLGRLRGIRVYVTGFAMRPGTLHVSSLSTLAQTLLQAGGPSATGSFRNIALKRGRTTVGTFDLYDLLLKGDRSMDQRLEADDVIHIEAVGTQVAVLGSVNRPAIFELKAGEGLAEVLQMAGGFSAVADTRRVALERFEDRGRERVTQIELPLSGRLGLANGDLIRAFNLSALAQPMGGQNKRVRIEGEVVRPGDYVLPPSSTIADAVRAAGGMTSHAYPQGAEFTRESVRQIQQQNYTRALRDFETQLLTASTTRRATTAEEVSASAASAASSRQLLERLSALKPTGRIVLQMVGGTTDLPDLVLEDGDRLHIPNRPNTVGVFGSVFSAGNYLHNDSRTIEDYLRLAGGPTRGADQSSIFVIRANGTVSSSLQESGLLKRGNQIAQMRAEPGDTIFVPEEIDKTSWIQNAKDWTQVLYQFGIGLAGIKSAVN